MPMKERKTLPEAWTEFTDTLLREAIIPFYRWFFRVTPLGRWYKIKPKYDRY